MPSEVKKWAKPTEGEAILPDTPTVGHKYSVPNVVYIAIGKPDHKLTEKDQAKESKEFKVIAAWFLKADDFKDRMPIDVDSFGAAWHSENAWGFIYMGHGEVQTGTIQAQQGGFFSAENALVLLHHHLARVIIAARWTAQQPWEAIASTNGGNNVTVFNGVVNWTLGERLPGDIKVIGNDPPYPVNLRVDRAGTGTWSIPGPTTQPLGPG
jgi:hypothetical protein